MNSLIIAQRVIRQIVKDPRTIALLLLAPLMMIFLLYTILAGPALVPNIQAVDLPSGLVEELQQEADVEVISDLDQAKSLLDSGEIDAIVTYQDATLDVYVEGTQSEITGAVKKAVATALANYAPVEIQTQIHDQLQQLLAPLLANSPNQQIGDLTITPDLIGSSFHYLYGSDAMDSFDNIAPLLMGFFIFFFVFILAGVAFLRERITGTLERLLATPVRRHEIVIGYFLGFGLFVFLQTLLMQLFMIYVLDIAVQGSFGAILVINLLLAAGSLALGTLLSAFARNELQLFQFIPIVIVPQILFCGLFSLKSAPFWLLFLAKIFPLTYGARALKDVALKGYGLNQIIMELAILFGYMALFIVLNTLALKKYRKI